MSIYVLCLSLKNPTALISISPSGEPGIVDMICVASILKLLQNSCRKRVVSLDNLRNSVVGMMKL